jgi:hypothetical protein
MAKKPLYRNVIDVNPEVQGPQDVKGGQLHPWPLELAQIPKSNQSRTVPFFTALDERMFIDLGSLATV